VDSNLYNNPKHLLKLCEAISAEGLDIDWGGDATVHIGEDEEVLRAMRKAGCRLLFIGFETPNQQSLDSVAKPNVASRYDELMKRIHGAGIAVAGYFIVGLDGDTRATFDDLFDFIHRTRINLPIVNVLLPAPGTTLWDRMKREGRLLIENEDELMQNTLFYNISCSRCFYRPARMSPLELEQGVLDLRRRLSAPRELFHRSAAGDLRLDAFMLAMNLEFWRETRRMTRAWDAPASR
jgi:radical SAM superfamily enzyme YgiQ (UPF0313 family)